MTETKNRLLKGCAYWRELKPSQMAILGTANPKQWAILQGFVALVEEYLGVRPPVVPTVAPSNTIKVEQMDTEAVKSIFQ